MEPARCILKSSLKVVRTISCARVVDARQLHVQILLMQGRPGGPASPNAACPNAGMRLSHSPGNLCPHQVPVAAGLLPAEILGYRRLVWRDSRVV